MNIQQIREARELYGIEGWGGGYFSIDDNGNVVCHPTGEEHLQVDLPEVIEAAKAKGVKAPLIIRFPQIIEGQIARLHNAFKEAKWDYSYEGNHKAVFPFKVNQRREFIDSIVECGKKYSYGLEVGSKPEFLAAISYELADDALFLCNGFKDAEFIKLGFAAKALGKNVVMIIEGPDELEHILDMAKDDPENCPDIGIRIKLYSRGSGKWAKSSGESSKFGLTTYEVLHCLNLLEKANLGSKLQVLHFHVGSQVTQIKRYKNAIKEASRVYSKVIKMGFEPQYLDIGGGVGVDYDGSKTSYQSSANYSLQELANSVVYEIGEVCKKEGVKAPDIVSESGRIIAAYHSLVATDVREVQSPESFTSQDGFNLEDDLDSDKTHKSLQELKYIIENINRKNYVEFYHDAIEYYEEMFTLFNLGYVNLKERAVAEQYFYNICRKALYFASFERHSLEEFDSLQKRMVSKYLANFSIFQSIPDSWAIDQLFPVIPLSHHHKKPSQKATIVDITCDSDGCLEKFIDRSNVRTILDLHTPDGKPYFLGFFLVGAYQESLANEHNLFGATDEIEVTMDEGGEWKISKITEGDKIAELLTTRNYVIKELTSSYEAQLQEKLSSGNIDENKKNEIKKLLEDQLEDTPYLQQKS